MATVLSFIAVSIRFLELAWSSSSIVVAVRITILAASSLARLSIRASNDPSLGKKPYTNYISIARAISRRDFIVMEPSFSLFSISITACLETFNLFPSCCIDMPIAVRIALTQPVGGMTTFFSEAKPIILLFSCCNWSDFLLIK